MHTEGSSHVSESDDARSALLSRCRRTRAATLALAAPLTVEDQLMQSMPSASPTKWHLAHTSWFFEKVVLEPNGVTPFDSRYGALFNSYYVSFGPRHARPERGLLSRPSLAEVHGYRAHVDRELLRLFTSFDAERFAAWAPTLELGIAHEEQHQELILTDVLHALSHNPLQPIYAPEPAAPHGGASSGVSRPMRFLEHAGGLVHIGRDEREGFCFDNEAPRHKAWLPPFELADRLVSVAELSAFLRDGGYHTASLWLSEGFDFVRTSGITAPLYMALQDGVLVTFGLHGVRVPDPDEPVCHLSYYEADALARYLGARLPTEAEWEVFAAAEPAGEPVMGHFVESGILHPLAPHTTASAAHACRQLFGDVWEWTASSYEPYPGFRAAPGALAEYNGKFMVNQRVLRGGSCLTPARHVRASYRNFWHPDTRFQMTGLRLARDATRP
jgi:ergothioneine biosynthesis protein EgtB